jgi:hypothetical protein
MLANVRKYKLMPEEVYSKRNRLADDGTLSKVFFYDIVRQLRWPAGLASVDADNCYDRIAHPMASMVFQAFDVPTPAIESMLTMIQNMNFSYAQATATQKVTLEETRMIAKTPSGRKVCAKATAHPPRRGQ